MGKYFFASFISILLILPLTAQIQIKYLHTTKLNNNIPLERHAVLEYFESTVQYYHSIGKDIISVDIYGNKGDEHMKVETTGNTTGILMDLIMQDEYGNVILSDLKNKTMKIRELVFFDPYIYSEPIPNINWNYNYRDKKQILGQKCNKATCSFRGRNYTAWFAPSLPHKIGPHKFNGLPGSILEIVDDEGKISISAYALTTEFESKKINDHKWSGKNITFDEYKSIYPKVRKELWYKYSSASERKSGMEKSKANTFSYFENF